VRRVVRIEDRNRQIIPIDDLDRAYDEGILCRKEFVTALIAARDFVEDTVSDEPVQYFSERSDRR